MSSRIDLPPLGRHIGNMNGSDALRPGISYRTSVKHLYRDVIPQKVAVPCQMLKKMIRRGTFFQAVRCLPGDAIFLFLIR